MPIKHFWEDFTPGWTFENGTFTLSAGEMVAFARQWDPQRYHVDEASARATPFGGLIASGWHTACICMRLIWDAYLADAASLGSPGVKELRWTRPVRPGDRLRLKMTVLEAKRSRTKPDRGTVLHRCEVYNQRGEVVMDMDGYGMFERRPR